MIVVETKDDGTGATKVVNDANVETLATVTVLGSSCLLESCLVFLLVSVVPMLLSKPATPDLLVDGATVFP